MRGYVLVGALALAGCSSTPETVNVPYGQYCYTDEQIVEKNGVVSAEKVVTCTDKPKVNHLTRSAGVAQQCREYTQRLVINNEVKNVKGFLCKFPGGRWEPVNGAFAY